MNLGEAVRAAAREIRVHKVRSLLSLSAISVGTASLLYTLAQTRGMQETLKRNLELMGPGALTITWYVPETSESTRHAPSASVVTVRSLPAASRTTTVASRTGRAPARVTTRPARTAGGGGNR